MRPQGWGRARLTRALIATTCVVTLAGASAADSASTSRATAVNASLVPWCGHAGAAYGISLTITGLQPNATIVGTLAMDGAGITGAVKAGPDGTYALTTGSSAPIQLATIKGYEDLNGNRTQDPGEPTFAASVSRPCSDQAPSGGTVTGSGDTTMASGEPVHFSLSGRSGPHGENPSGTITEQVGDAVLHGTVTCLTQRGEVVAAIGIALDQRRPGDQPAQIIQASGFGGPNGPSSILMSPSSTAPGPSACPQPGSGANQYAITNGSITIIAADTTPPVVHLPGTIILSATTPTGTALDFVAGATDDQDPFPTVACTPANRSVFPIGRTVVRCIARDRSGNSSRGSFAVLVRGSEQQRRNLRSLAGGVPAISALSRSRARLVRAAIALATGRVRTPCGALAVAAVQVRQAVGHGLRRGQARILRSATAHTRVILGCDPPPNPRPTLTLSPACDPKHPDLGGGHYGISAALSGFAPNTPIELAISDPAVFSAAGGGPLTIDVHTDPVGAYSPFVGSLGSPLGLVTVSAFSDPNANTRQDPGEPTLASATIDNPCVAAPAVTAPAGTRR
jgi:HYR domain